MSERAQTTRTGGEASLGDLLRQLGTDLGRLIRQELALVRKETKEDLQSLALGAGIVAAGAVLSMLALGTLTTAAVLALGERMGYTTAAVVVGVVLSATAAGAIAWGARHIRRNPIKPEKTLETLEETKQWMKDLT